MPVAIARMLGSKMMSDGSKPASSVSSRYARSQISTLRSTVSACPCSSNAITTTAAPYRLIRRAFSRKSSSPSFRLIEFTMPLALHALQAGLDHRPLGAVDHDRHARDLRLGRDEVQERGHRLLGVEQVGVHVHVDQVRAAPHLLERDVDAALVVAGLDQAAELRRAGDVGALADHHEPGVGRDAERLEAAEGGEAIVERRAPGGGRRRSPRRRSCGCAPAWCRSSRPRCSPAPPRRTRRADRSWSRASRRSRRTRSGRPAFG